MISINFFGTGIRYWVCEIPETEFSVIKNVKEKTGKVWEELFFDLSFLESLGYPNWEAIHLLEEGKGWLIAQRNRLEIRVGKKKRTIDLEEFLGDALFDGFRKKVIAFDINRKKDFQYVLLLQMDTGMINKYEMEEDSLDLDQLLYWFFDGRGEGLDLLWLTKVEYDGQELFDKGDDCLTRQNMVRIL